MNRLRPVYLLVALAAAFHGWAILPDPAWVVTDEGVGAPRSVANLLVVFLGPGVPVLLLGVVGAWGVGGGRALRCGARYLCGLDREGEHLHAHHGLRAAARAMVSGGLTLGLLGAAAAFLLVGDAQSGELVAAPADVAYLLSWALLSPLTALGVGRLVLGVAADGAAVRAGTPERRAFAGRDDLLLLLFLLPPVMTFTAAMWPAAPIR